MYCILWKYEVEPSKHAEFEKEYSRNGTWFKFFEPCDDYLGHDLLKNTQENSYSLIDRWMSKEDYEGFLKSNQTEYDQMNQKSSSLYTSETCLGTFELIQ
jgi:heme-degrading monooxygenase HmoA